MLPGSACWPRLSRCVLLHWCSRTHLVLPPSLPFLNADVSMYPMRLGRDRQVLRFGPADGGWVLRYERPSKL